MATAGDELVLLIHGTFAQPEKGKLKWWQIDSGPWKEIQKRLPKGTQLADRKEIFYWSGQNQERDRYQAGIRLLNRLLQLEKQDRPYHLVGHSHGGSVIWHALQEATRRRIGKKRPDPRLQLSRLCSWATVGTPFLQYHESGMGRWPGAILTKLILLVSYGLTFFLAYWLIQRREIVVKNLQTIVPNDTGLLSVAVIIIALALAAILGMALHMWVSAIRQEALSVRQTAFVRNQAMREFGDRWLGLWSREDEAIGGLRGSIRLRVQLLPKLQFRSTRVFLYDRRVWTYRFLLRWILAPILNRFVPIGNRMILSTMSKTAQGDDRPGCLVTSVSEGPVCLRDKYQYPTLPEYIDGALTKGANDRLIEKAPDLVPKVRTLLADFSSGVAMLGGGVKAAGIELGGDELIHTSYFEHPGVLDLLAHHIGVHCREPSSDGNRDDALGKWYLSTREDVKSKVTENPTVRKRSLAFLGKRNRLALLAVACGLLALFGLMAAAVVGDLQIKMASGGVALLTLFLGRIGQLRAEKGARSRRSANIAVNLGILWFAILALTPVLDGVNWVSETYFSEIPAAVKKAVEEEVIAVSPSEHEEGIKGYYYVTQNALGEFVSNKKDRKVEAMDDQTQFSDISSFELRISDPMNRPELLLTARSILVIRTNEDEVKEFPLAIQNRTDLRFFTTIQAGIGERVTGNIVLSSNPSSPNFNGE